MRRVLHRLLRSGRNVGRIVHWEMRQVLDLLIVVGLIVRRGRVDIRIVRHCHFPEFVFVVTSHHY